MKRKRLEIVLTLALLVLGCSAATSSELSERLIIKDNSQDSALIRTENASFDKDGNYCFLGKQKGLFSFLTNNGVVGSFSYVNYNGEVYNTSPYDAGSDSLWYYKNFHGVRLYGNARGTILSRKTFGTKECVALITQYKDSAYYYLNGTLVSATSMKDYYRYFLNNEKWFAFSENGNSIYYCKPDSMYILYVNGKAKDSSGLEFTGLAVNNSGNYIYAEGLKSKDKNGANSYSFFIHSQDTVLGPVRSIRGYGLQEDGSWFFVGDSRGPSYIAVNGRFFGEIKSITNIILLDRKNFYFEFSENDSTKINVNGKTYSHSYQGTFNPALDKNGNFALFGLKNNNLYKFINGKEQATPVAKPGILADPLYIGPKGNSIYVVNANDSIYLYSDGKLLFKPIAKKSGIIYYPRSELLSASRPRTQYRDGSSLFYLEFDSAAYYVFNGVLSKKMMPARFMINTEKPAVGDVIQLECVNNGFYMIQKTAPSRYMININNEIYQELDNIGKLLPEYCFFDGKELVVYGTKGLSFYRFSIGK